MMNKEELFEKIAKATVKIECEIGSSGSGFCFFKNDFIVTNHHVIKACLERGKKIFAKTENGDGAELKLLEFSSEDEYDFAILKIKEKLEGKEEVFQPKISTLQRGIQVCFSGFPHGIDDLLVQTAYISGPFKDIGFYIDGSVNGGNSGSPIVDIRDGTVIGIITQRRFLTPIDLDDVHRNLSILHDHFQRMGGVAGVRISGIDFGQFAQLMSRTFNIFGKILLANANTGIGIGYRIDFLTEKIKSLTV